jgi:hypothetical protein
MFTARRSFVMLSLILLAGSSQPTRAADNPEGLPSLEKALLQQAPQIIKYLRENNYQNVGVLKFRVKKGQERASDSAGPLNLNLANRLEVALVLAAPSKAEKPIGIIHNASAVAAKLKGANHLTKEGREALFEGRYALPWGDQEVSADVFLTGVVAFDKDMQSMNVGIGAFDKSAELKKVCSFEA